MTKMKIANKALLSSIVALVLCCAMLIGTTFAWFTDSASTSVHTIQSGTLDIVLADENGNELTAPLSFVDANGKTDILWEPGATFTTQQFQLKNEGDLALKYEIFIKDAEGDVELLEALEFSLGGDSVELNGDKLTGELKPGESTGLLTLTGHMKAEAGNEYQDMKVTGIHLYVRATQNTVESDSVDNQYDKDAQMKPHAFVSTIPATTVNATLGMGGAATSMTLDTAYSFKTTESFEQAQNSEYKYWHADFVVYADKNVPADSMALAGYYAAYCDGYNNNNWVALQAGEDIAANTPIRLLELMLNGGSMSYQELCNWVPEFKCGAVDLTGVNNGTTLTVELRLYEVLQNTASVTDETGKYITIGVYKHTFTEKVSTADELKDALSAGTSVSLTADVDLGTEQISVPTGAKVVLDLNGHDVVGTQEGTKTYGLFNVVGGAELTVVGDGNVTVKANVTSGISACIFQNDGTLNIYGGNYEANQEASVAGLGAVIAVIDNCPYNTEAVVNIYDGTFAVTGVGAINVIRNWPIHAEGVATLNVYGGLFKANPTVSTTYLWNKDDSTPATLNSFMNFYGGTFEAGVVYEDYNGQDDIYVAPGVTIQPYSGNN